MLSLGLQQNCLQYKIKKQFLNPGVQLKNFVDHIDKVNDEVQLILSTDKFIDVTDDFIQRIVLH